MADARLEPTRLVLDWGPRWTLSLFDLGLACCAVEFVAASVTAEAFLRPADVPAGVVDAEVLVVSGTLTDVTAPAVLELYAAMREPRYVISFGACANCGGPYWDSYSVTKGVDQLLPVDVYVPGCPPRPEALLDALLSLQPAAAPRSAELLQAPLVRPPTASPVVGLLPVPLVRPPTASPVVGLLPVPIVPPPT